MIDPHTDRVLITGAAGLVGSALREHLRPAYRHLLLTDLRGIPDLARNEEAVLADITDRAAMEQMVAGCKALVHLAGLSGSGDLEALFRANVRGLFDALEAARLGGIKRIVFASSNHAFGCYPIEVPVSPAMPPRPDSLYGAFKVLGETMLRTYYERHGITSVSLRIGTFRKLPIDQRSLATWLSPRDVAQLVDLSLRHPDPGCLVINGYSGNTRIKTRDPNWAFLGYVPLDNAEDHVGMLREMGVDVDGPWEWQEHGGSFARAEERPARLPSAAR
jgi:uronate dehydrogenase